MNINKSPRRIKRDAGGRNKNPMAQLVRSPFKGIGHSVSISIFRKNLY